MNKRTPAYLVLKSAVLFLSLLCFYPLSATNPQKKERNERVECKESESG